MGTLRKITPQVESTEIIAQINLFLEILKSRNHEILDWENPDCKLQRVAYDENEDTFYCFFNNL